MPKSLEATEASEQNQNSLTPPPPLPLRSSKYDQDEADFPPPPAFEDASLTTSVKVVVPPPPPPLPKPSLTASNLKIPPPPPPNSNKIQIFTKSPLKAFKAKTASNPKLGPKSDTASTLPKKKETFDEELKQKLIAKQLKTFDESQFRGRGYSKEEAGMEAELEAILKKRREKLSSSPNLVARKSSFHHPKMSLDDDKVVRKTSSFRSFDESLKFNTLPHRFKAPKPRVPEKKPTVFVRETSLKLQTWNRMSAGNKCI